MPPTNREPHGWIGDLLSGLLDAISGDSIEIACWLLRVVGHALFIAVRVAFHLLTCHF